MNDKAQFGKHKGKTKRWIMDNDPGYFRWAAVNVPNLFGGQKSNSGGGFEAKPVVKPVVYEEPPEEPVGSVGTSTWFYEIGKRMLEGGG